jgi:hypothetical protein
MPACIAARPRNGSERTPKPLVKLTALDRLGRGDGDGALLELLELLPAHEQGLEIRIGGANRLDFLERTADSALAWRRLGSRPRRRTSVAVSGSGAGRPA